MVNLMNKVLCLCFGLVIPVFINGIYVDNNVTRTIKTKVHKPLTPAEWTEPYGLWGNILEDYTINQSITNREGRVIQSNHKYIPTNGGFYITKRIGESFELESNRRQPPQGKVIQPPLGVRQNNYGIHPMAQTSQREVSETDLYLLGAIEKLVFRVDYMDKRLRRVEQLVYYLMAGNNQKEEPCPENFIRVAQNCYYFGIKEQNWKSANTMCRSLGSHLAEFETNTENQDMVNYIFNQQHYKGKDFWIGGLNPGLLWIWSNSAKPVNPNTNLTSISSLPSSSASTSNVPLKSKEKISTTGNETNTFEIKGTGRCLRLSYNPNLNKYEYTGQECTSRHGYLCEFKDRSLDNEISRIAKELKLN